MDGSAGKPVLGMGRTQKKRRSRGILRHSMPSQSFHPADLVDRLISDRAVACCCCPYRHVQKDSCLESVRSSSFCAYTLFPEAVEAP